MKRRALRTGLLLCAAAATLLAQPPVAPTDEPTQSTRGDNVSGYNILQSFELGYRWNTVGGDDGMYRATVNYGNGVRLLSSSLFVQSRDGHGKWFDQLQLSTEGLGNDPYESAILRIEKNRLYRYDLMWRSDAYYNPALTISYGEHFMDTVRHLQDQDLTLFPQGRLQVLLGYSRDTQSGPALTTIQLFDGRGDEYPLFANIRREQNEYRAGFQLKLFGFTLNALHGWEDFKDDTPVTLPAPSQGNNPNDLASLTSFQRAEPYHGTSPYWRVALLHEGEKYWAANGRFTYVAGQRGFVLDESSAGTDRIGFDTQRQVLTYGDAQRPTATGNFTFSVFPSSKITLTNQTSVYNIRIMGNSYFEQYTNGSAITPILFFNYLGILTIANSTDMQIRVLPWLSVHGGYDYDNRRIASIQSANFVTSQAAPGPAVDQTNRLNAGTLGFVLRPGKRVTIGLDAEIGRANKPLDPIAEKNYQAFGGRVQYKRGPLRLAAYASTNYNTNSASLANFASRSRQYGADASWTARQWFSLDASFAKLHLDTLGAIQYFADQKLVTGTQSYYVSNVYTGTLMARLTVLKRADISIGYSQVQDVGDGRSNPFDCAAATVANVTVAPSGQVAGNSSCGGFSALLASPQATVPAFAAAQTFPLRYLSPQGRLSLRITSNVRWNAGYQYYGYREEFSALQDYRAHTGYSSVSWSF